MNSPRLPIGLFALLLAAAAVLVTTPATLHAQDDQPAAAETTTPATPQSTDNSFQSKIDAGFGKLVGWIAPVLFVDTSFGYVEGGVPLIVLVLLFGGVFFTFRFGFVHLRLFAHSIQVIRGRYDNPDDHGEITHFKALTSALSATVGLGNIAMVAVAIAQGGPGAVFWMWVIAFFGMSSKFTSCSLAQVYRNIEPEDDAQHTGKSEHVLGGPMLYLQEGVKRQLGGGAFAAGFGKTLAIVFAIFAIGGAIGGGNMFQANQTFEIVAQTFLDGDKSYAWVGGIIMAGLVGIVIIGGIKRIGEVTCRLVPAMCAFYCLVCLVIILANASKVPGLFGDIFAAAFNFKAATWGGMSGLIGVFVVGAKRAAFSNEAGLGSAAIAHSAAKTNEPVREGVVAMIGPFIDTIIICTMTALTILITGAHKKVAAFSGTDIEKGVSITAEAFKSLAPWLTYLLCIAVFVFAYSTMISWCYYGERATEYLFGKKGVTPFRVIFLLFVFLGPIASLHAVIDFTDILILSMAYPNIIGAIILSPKLAKLTKDYVRRLKSGEMKTYAQTQQQTKGQPSI